MTSAIDPTLPVSGNPTTASVRSNFSTAASEISALQIFEAGGPFLPIAGGTLTGSLILAGDPTTNPMMAATKGYVDSHSGTGGGGIPEAPADSTLYGRINGAWQHAASTTLATETVAGIVLVATTAQVTAGTDNAASVTSLKLAQRLTSLSGTYVTNTGNSTINGQLTLAPSAASSSPFLILNRHDAAGVNAIIGQQAGAEYWRINLTDTNNNFAIRSNFGPFSGQQLLFESSTGFANIAGVNFGPDQGQVPALMGASSPVSAALDYFLIACRRLNPPVSGNYRDGPLLILRGPTSTLNANGIELSVGSVSSGYRQFVFTSIGDLTVPRNAIVTGVFSVNGTGYALTIPNGGIAIGGTLQVNGSGTSLNISTGSAVIAGALSVNGQSSGWAISCSTGGIYLHGGGDQVVYVDNGGIRVASDSIFETDLHVYGKLRGGSSTGDSGNIKGWGTSDWFNFRWDGTCPYVRVDDSYERIMVISQPNNLYQVNYGQSGPTGWTIEFTTINGVAIDIFADQATSDARIKDKIADSEIDALAALCAIPIRQFEFPEEIVRHYASLRSESDSERETAMENATAQFIPIGVVAQEVQPHVPQAVVTLPPPKKPEALGPLPEDMLGIKRDEFIVYLIRAVQQLQDRLAAVEAR